MQGDLELRASKIARGLKRLAPEDREWVRRWFSVSPAAGITAASLTIALEASDLVRDAIGGEDTKRNFKHVKGAKDSATGLAI